ncbi:MAG: DNA repair exonuclease [Pirellulaceae bacterium]|nr:DNA repair exonuclease [Pirellulaceae bacterium]
MSPRKILHAADIHLDSPLQQLGGYDDAPADEIRGASRRALENMTQLAIEQQVDLVVIAGDLYDGDWRDQNTGLFFVSQASRLVQAGIPLVVIRGNHDALNVMTSSLPLPDNPDGSEIMMAADRVDCRIFESIGVCVQGRSFGKREQKEGLAAQYPAPVSGMFNLGLLHTSLNGAEGHDNYAPCTPAQLTDKEYDYWALGHIHLRGEHGIDGGAPIVFSGNIQGRHIRESGPKGCVIVDIDAQEQTTRTFYPLDVVRWQLCEIDVSLATHRDDVLDSLQQWIRETLPRIDDRMLVVRVRLVGATPMHSELHRSRRQFEAALRSITVTDGEQRTWLEKVRIATTAPVETTAGVELDGPMESITTVVNQMRDAEDSDQMIRDELSKLLGKIPVELLGNVDSFGGDDDQWSRRLIESAAADLMGRLHGQEAAE